MIWFTIILLFFSKLGCSTLVSARKVHIGPWIARYKSQRQMGRTGRTSHFISVRFFWWVWWRGTSITKDVYCRRLEFGIGYINSIFQMISSVCQCLCHCLPLLKSRWYYHCFTMFHLIPLSSHQLCSSVTVGPKVTSSQRPSWPKLSCTAKTGLGTDWFDIGLGTMRMLRIPQFQWTNVAYSITILYVYV